MILLLAAVFAVLFLPWPWNVAVILAVAVWEPTFVVIAMRWSRRRRSQVGAQALICRCLPVVRVGRCLLPGEVALMIDGLGAVEGLPESAPGNTPKFRGHS